MKALRFDKIGDLNNLTIKEQPLPEPDADEVLVRVYAAGVNRSDPLNVFGHFKQTTLPRTPGRDFAGIVEKGPAALCRLAVWGTGGEFGITRDGSHADYLLVPATGVALKPPALSFCEAAACGVPYTTAWYALASTGVRKGTRLVVIGAAGAVGSSAVWLARMRGAHVLGIVRRTEQAEWLEGQDVAAGLVGETRPLADTVRQHFPDGAEVVFDATGAWLAESVGVLAPFGRIAVIVVPGDGRASIPLRDLYSICGSIIGVASQLYLANDCARMLYALAQGFVSGQLHAPPLIKPRPLSEAREVYQSVRSGEHGKFLLVPPNSPVKCDSRDDPAE
jgi:NADPH:quinone reductase-like Zn-dependent oxidoreductase